MQLWKVTTGKSCVKTNCTQTPQYRHMTERHENKAAYQTPKIYHLPKTNYGKKISDVNKQFFKLLGEEEPLPEKRLHSLHHRTNPTPSPPRTNGETLIYTTTAEIAGKKYAVELESSPLARFKT